MTIATSGCTPLRSTQTQKHETLVLSDTTLTELFRQEFERQIGTFRQTVVEFYPPAERSTPREEDSPDPPDTLLAVPPPKIPPKNAVRQPVRRITYTEASTENDRTILTDSISRSRINAAARNDTQTVTEEKPSSGVMWLRWATALAGVLLLILLLVKLR